MSKPYYFKSRAGVNTGKPQIVVDVCIYGQGPGGVTAAVELSRRGRSVALIINSPWLGGLTTGGLSNTDIGNKGSIGGMAREFYRRAGARYGVKEKWRFEPHVAEEILREFLAEAGVTPIMDEHVVSVSKQGKRLVSMTCESGLSVRARMFIDASYEGDLMALAGVSYTVGREGNAKYGERINGVQMHDTHQFDFPVDPYRVEGDPSSGLLPGINPEPLAPIGSGDKKMQAYNFRLCLSKQPENRIEFEKPEGYDALDYELLARYFKAGWTDLFHKFDLIRGKKTDTNNHGAVSTDFIGGNWNFPEASLEIREKIFQAHVRWQKGLLWFIANDERVTKHLQDEFKQWGLAKDEFKDTGGWPRQLYIREARRMVSDYVVTEADCRGETHADDGVGLGAYAMDSHNCQRVVVDGKVRNEGDVQELSVSPYPIPYRSIVPRRNECSNLLVTVCVSASHIAFGSVRMEPVFMILGQSAAIGADLALSDEDAVVQDIDRSALKKALLECGQVIEWTDKAAAYEPEAEFSVSE